jgi:CBS domain-containing protein
MHLPDDIQDHLATVVARDAMSKEVVTVDPETPIDDDARTMLSHRIHRVLVSGGSGIEGLLTTFDLLRAIARPEPESHAIRHTGYQR